MGGVCGQGVYGSGLRCVKKCDYIFGFKVGAGKSDYGFGLRWVRENVFMDPALCWKHVGKMCLCIWTKVENNCGRKRLGIWIKIENNREKCAMNPNTLQKYVRKMYKSNGFNHLLVVKAIFFFFYTGCGGDRTYLLDFC